MDLQNDVMDIVITWSVNGDGPTVVGTVAGLKTARGTSENTLGLVP
jgi:hypothetical protein